MTDLEQRVAAALHDGLCRIEDHYRPHRVGGKDGGTVYWTPCHPDEAKAIIAALAASGLAITEAPDAEGAHTAFFHAADHSTEEERAACIICNPQWPKLTPPSSVDGEGLRAALQAKSEAYHAEFITDAGGHFAMAWSNCTAPTCVYDRELLAASGSASGAAEEPK